MHEGEKKNSNVLQDVQKKKKVWLRLYKLKQIIQQFAKKELIGNCHEIVL